MNYGQRSYRPAGRCCLRSALGAKGGTHWLRLRFSAQTQAATRASYSVRRPGLATIKVRALHSRTYQLETLVRTLVVCSIFHPNDALHSR